MSFDRDILKIDGAAQEPGGINSALFYDATLPAVLVHVQAQSGGRSTSLRLSVFSAGVLSGGDVLGVANEGSFYATCAYDATLPAAMCFMTSVAKKNSGKSIGRPAVKKPKKATTVGSHLSFH